MKSGVYDKSCRIESLIVLVTDDECREEDGGGHGAVDGYPHVAHQGHLLVWNGGNVHISDQQLWPGYGQVMTTDLGREAARPRRVSPSAARRGWPG